MEESSYQKSLRTKSLRTKILHCRRSPPRRRRHERVYWPGMNSSIHTFKAHCTTCATIDPSQPREPIILTPAPEWPFQQIVDIYHVGYVAYIACTDRLTGWLFLCHLKPGYATSSKLMSICRHLFQTYSTPDEPSTDGGPPFTSSKFPEFLQTWCVRHTLSSVPYSQSNARAMPR